MQREEAKEMIRLLLPEVWLTSAFLSPEDAYKRANIPAKVVFDVIRVRCDPPMTEAEFNEIADEVTA